MKQAIITIQDKHFPSHFFEDALRRTNWGYAFLMLNLFLLPASVYIFRSDSPMGSIIPSLMGYYTILFLHIGFRLKKNSANFLAPDLIFIGLYTVFHLGYITLFALEIVPYTKAVFFFDASAPKALLVVNIGLLAFIIGYEIAAPKGRRQAVPVQTLPSQNWCSIGTAIMAAGLCIHLGTLMMVGPGVFLKHGYDAVQNISKYTGYLNALLWAESIHLILYGLLIHISAACLLHRKVFHGPFALGLAVAVFAVVVMEGDRGPILKFGIPILLAKHYFVAPVKFKTAALIVMILLFSFTAISVARTVVLNPKKMWAEFQEKKEKQHLNWTAPFVEMGGSFLILSIVCNDIPEKIPYWNGRTWRNAVIHVVPFFQRVAARSGWDSTSPSTWITETYFGKDRAGRAFTVSAEGYLNLGFPGVFLELFFFGFVIRRISVGFALKRNGFRLIILLGWFVASLLVIRNHVNLVFNVYFQVVLIAFLASFFKGRIILLSSRRDGPPKMRRFQKTPHQYVSTNG